jgi:DNA modification methylase
MLVIEQKITSDYALYNSDVMEVLPGLPSESIDVSIYSPPFPELYQYSDNPRDVSNCVSYDETLNHYRFVVEQIVRLTKPGRLSCVHCCDLKRGILYQHDFPGDVVRIHEEFNMHYFCRTAIWKDAWEFARRTRMKTLMHKTIVEDACRSRIAPGDHLLVFLKPGENRVPVTHEHGFKHYAGANPIPRHLHEYLHWKGDQRENSLSHWIYRQYASPVWMDIRRGRLMPFDEEREDPEEKHICPLQLDVIERCLALWSNPGETMLTPFMGVGSEVYQAVRMGRRAIGCELKATYYRQALENIDRAYLPEEDELPLDLTPDQEEQETSLFREN